MLHRVFAKRNRSVCDLAHARRATPRRVIESLESRVFLDATYHDLSAGNFGPQTWTGTSGLLGNDNWGAVPSIIGYLGDGMTPTATSTDPQVMTGDSTSIDLINASTAGSNSGGVHEINDDVVALQGSGGAIAPYLALHMDATGRGNINVSYTLRELDGTTVDQKFALQYRVGTGPGGWINVPAGAVSGVFNGSGSQTQPMSVTLPTGADNAAQLQIRIITHDAPTSDAMVGIDDISVTSSPAAVSLGLTSTSAAVNESAASVSFTVSRSSGAGSASFDYTTTNGTATAGSDFTTTAGSHTFNPGETSTLITIPLTPSDTNVEPIEQFTLDLSNIAGAAPGATSATITITDNDKPAAGTGKLLSAGALTQNWNDTAQITTDDDWSGVAYFFGYRGDNNAHQTPGIDPRSIVAPLTEVLDVNANKDSNYLFTTGEQATGTGGVAEIEVDVPNPTISLNGSGTADSPFVLFEVDTTGVDAVNVAYNVRDLEIVDNAAQQVVLQYRVGSTGDFTNVLDSYIADATDLNDTLVTPVNVIVAGPVANQPLVQFRVMTTNALGNDEFIGIDDIVVQQTTNAPGALTFEPFTQTVSEGVGTAQVKVVRTGGDLGAVSVDYNVTTGSAGAGDFESTATGTLNFADGDVEEFIEIDITDDTTAEVYEDFSVTLSNAQGGAALGGITSKTVRIADNDVYKLADADLEQDWTDISQLTVDDDWGNVLAIRGYLGDGLTGGTGTDPTSIEDFGSGTLDLNPNQFDPVDFISGGVTEFELANPTIALAGSGTADAPFLLFELDTTGAASVDFSYTLRDIEDGGQDGDDAAQQVALQYRIGNTGDFLNVTGSHVTDATILGLGPDIPQSFNIPEAGNQPLVQFRIMTTNAVGNDEWVGIDDIVIAAGEGVVLPPWLDPASIAVWDDANNVLTVSGDSTIIADPADSGDAPKITVAGEGVVLDIDPTSDLVIHIEELHVQNAARVNLVTLGGARTAANHRALVVGSDGFTIDATSTLDLADNDLVIDYDELDTQLTDVAALIGSGYNFGGHDSPGIVSSTAANVDPFTFTLGYADNAFLPLPYGSTLGGVPFAGEDVDDTAILVKYTWVGDVTLDGIFDFQDLSIFNGNYDSGATTGRVWTDGDLNFDGTIDFQDLSLFNGNYDPNRPAL